MELTDHLDKLKAFKVIAECGTMREAALKLNVTQPSLTRLVQTLEISAGLALLVRGRSGVAPTEAGQLLLAFAKETLKNLEDLEERLHSPADRLSGHLRVGSFESLTEYLWPEFMAAFRKTTPQLKISIRTHHPATHFKALAEGQLDLIVDAEPRVVGDLTSWTLYEDRFQFYTGTRQQEVLTPETLKEMTLITCPAAYDRDGKGILQHLEEAGYFLKERIELDSFTSVMAFCQSGLGIAALPQRLAARALKGKEIFPVKLKGFPEKGFGAHSIAATIRAERSDDPRVRFLIKSLKAWFRG
jgi:DNA-binding transcriptional LysR family regulator